MIFEEFITKLNGKYLEVAGSSDAKNQCVDLANGYIRDVLGFPIIEWTNAKDFPSKGGDRYEFIKNTPEGIPKEGDLVIWGNGVAGHIAIFIEGNADRFRSFDENYPTGSPCHIQNHNYLNITGWMHPKVPVPVDDSIKQRADAFISVAERLNKAADKDVVLADIDRLIKLEDVLRDRQKDLDVKDAKLTELSQTIDKLTKDNGDLKMTSDALQFTIGEQKKEIIQVQTELTILKNQKPSTELTRIDYLLKFIFG